MVARKAGSEFPCNVRVWLCGECGAGLTDWAGESLLSLLRRVWAEARLLPSHAAELTSEATGKAFNFFNKEPLGGCLGGWIRRAPDS